MGYDYIKQHSIHATTGWHGRFKVHGQAYKFEHTLYFLKSRNTTLSYFVLGEYLLCYISTWSLDVPFAVLDTTALLRPLMCWHSLSMAQLFFDAPFAFDFVEKPKNLNLWLLAIWNWIQHKCAIRCQLRFLVARNGRIIVSTCRKFYVSMIWKRHVDTDLLQTLVKNLTSRSHTLDIALSYDTQRVPQRAYI